MFEEIVMLMEMSFGNILESWFNVWAVKERIMASAVVDYVRNYLMA